MIENRSTVAATRRVSESALARAGERMVRQIEELVADIVALRRENETLQTEVRHALVVLERATSALGRTRTAADGTGRRRPAKPKGPKGRATPVAVTGDVVRAVLVKLGTATAAEIAEEITHAGVPVSGRAVRFLAERAGAVTVVGEDGKRRYRFG